MTSRFRAKPRIRQIPLQISVIYGIIGAAWILLSDRLLLMLVKDPWLVLQLQTYKGWFYVLFTAAILYLLIRHYLTAMQRQFDEIRTIFDSLHAIVYVVDFDTYEVLYLNQFGENLAGTSNWQGKTCFELLQNGQREPCDFCTNDRLVVNGKIQPPYTWEFRNTRNQRWYQAVDKAIHWSDGRLVRLEVAIDISETKGLEQLKEEMLSAVSHEMRTPLTAILGFAEFMLDSQPAEKERRYFLKILLQEAQRLSRLIDNFLRLTRLKARRESYRMQPLNPTELLHNALGKFSQGLPQHSLHLEIVPGVKAFSGDFDSICLALDNLLTNAVKYSPNGGDITIGAYNDNGEVVLWVRDQGIGMEKSELDLIFNDFYRIDNTDRRRTGGAGLGLTLVREIVQLHQGRVRVASSPGSGSTFYLSFPALAESSTNEQPDPISPN